MTAPGPDDIRFDRPDSLLDAIRDRADWDEERRGLGVQELIARFPPDELAASIRPRLASLAGRDGETLIALVEGLARQELFAALADSLAGQSHLPADLLWLGMEVLEGTGLVEERPELLAIREELDDLIEDHDAFGDLADQIEREPESVPDAIEALAMIEPDIRHDIIIELGRKSTSPAIVAFLERLAEDEDREIRAAANVALGRDVEPPTSGSEIVPADPHRSRLARSAIGPLDHEGRAWIVVWPRPDIGGPAIAAFRCDLRVGLVETLAGADEADEVLDSLPPRLGGDVAWDCHAVAIRLVMASAVRAGDALSEEARRLVEDCLGEGIAASRADVDAPLPAVDPGADLDGDARVVLDRRPEWLDRSDLVCELADGWRLRANRQLPDPVLDPGPFRVLFEDRIAARIPLYRDMLLWSALVWQTQGMREIADSAVRLAAALGDPQNAVPSHPFLALFMARSMREAIRRPRDSSD